MNHQDQQQGTAPPPVVLTIAGFDPSSGAGITADLQVFAAHGLFNISAITALTVQSTLGVAAVHPVAPEVLRHTLEHLADDIRPAGIKIGMLGSAAAVHEVAAFLQNRMRAGNQENTLPIVLDPVLRSSSGAALLDERGLAALHGELLAQVTWITPNGAELAALTGRIIRHSADLRAAMQGLAERHPHLQCVVTGGDAEGAPEDLWRAPDGTFTTLTGERVETLSTHGTGCAFSSALLSFLVLGEPPAAALVRAKAYVEGALRHAPEVGHGRGPLGLLWPLQPRR